MIQTAEGKPARNRKAQPAKVTVVHATHAGKTKQQITNPALERALKEAKMSKPERSLLFQLRALRLPEPEIEFAFARSLGRKWRADMAYPQIMMLIEIEGGVTPYRDPHTHELRDRGRHLTISGFTADAIKYNSAALLGYRVLRFTPAMVDDGSAVAMIEEALR